MEILTTIAGTLSLLKTATDLIKAGKAKEAAETLRELQGHILRLQMDFSEVIEENRHLREQLENKEYLKELEKDLEMEADGQFYVRKSKREKSLIPYCPVCWHAADNLVPLVKEEPPGLWKCAIHNSAHYTEAYHEWKKKQGPACAGVDPPRRSIWDRQF